MPVLSKTADWENITNAQVAKTIINYQFKFEHVQTTW